jgi:hypothetical protein
VTIPCPPPTSLAEHWDFLWYLLVIIIGGGLVEFRLFLRKLSTKQDELKSLHTQCQLDLNERFPAKKDFDNLLKVRERDWRVFFFPHTHYPSGEVKVQRIVEASIDE